MHLPKCQRLPQSNPSASASPGVMKKHMRADPQEGGLGTPKDPPHSGVGDPPASPWEQGVGLCLTQDSISQCPARHYSPRAWFCPGQAEIANHLPNKQKIIFNLQFPLPPGHRARLDVQFRGPCAPIPVVKVSELYTSSLAPTQETLSFPIFTIGCGHPGNLRSHV